MMSVSQPGQRRERKARDLNPHGREAARFSKPARQTVSGYPPYRVDIEWTRRESNPHYQHARLASSRWTTGPLVGQWRRWESSPSQSACKADSPPRYMRPQDGAEVQPGVDPGPPPYQGGVPP